MKKKSIIYKNLFVTYILVILGFIIVFDYSIIRIVNQNIKKNKYSVGENLAYDLNYGIERIKNTNKVVIQNLYYDEYVTRDIIKYLDLGILEYIKLELQKEGEFNGIYYKGINSFIKELFRFSESIENISFISYTKEEIRKYNRLMEIRVEKLDNLNLEKNREFPEFIYEKDSIIIANSINNPSDVCKEEGKLLVKYNLKDIKNTMKKYSEEYEALILDNKGYVIYDSTGNYSYELYPEFNNIEKMDEGKIQKLNNKYNAFKLKLEDGINIIFKINKTHLIKKDRNFYSIIIAISITLFVLSLAIIKSKLEKFTKRMDDLIVAMELVKAGDFNVDIPIGKEKDEISYMAENFNQMCNELDSNIKRSYIAELNQKKAEMQALQNQINPHFLYNTLECIRMRAVCNGDKEIGKMLYHLSFLFRKQVKDKNIIILKDELDYCQRYIEIFKFRYTQKLTYEINCDDDLKNVNVIKFVLQPLVENYFVHGIRLTDSDNYININVVRKFNDVEIIIEDNGTGITEEKLRELEMEIKSKHSNKMSIGIVNVQQRITSEYGEEYGLKFKLGDNGGTIVILKIPYHKEG